MLIATFAACASTRNQESTGEYVDDSVGVRLILRSKLGEMTVNKERPEMLPAIA
jgi:hypothetical protein